MNKITIVTGIALSGLVVVLVGYATHDMSWALKTIVFVSILWLVFGRLSTSNRTSSTHDT